MALKTSRKVIEIKDITFDKEIYPRTGTDFITIAKYYNAMKAGAVFPKITLAAFAGKMYLVDGAHRLEAMKGFLKIKKITKIEVDWFVANSKTEMYETAVRLNATHGKPFNTQEVVRIIAKLEDFKYDKKDISELVRIPVADMTRFTATRLARTVGTNEPIALNSMMRHLAGTDQSVDFAEEQEGSLKAGGANQHVFVDTFLSMLEKGWINLNDEVIVEKLMIINKLLNNILKVKKSK